MALRAICSSPVNRSIVSRADRSSRRYAFASSMTAMFSDTMRFTTSFPLMFSFSRASCFASSAFSK
eukprot:258775-Chlamydomonas_euryale.AAC.1